MFETFGSEAELCDVLGPSYPASGMFDEAIRDRQPKEIDWTDALPAEATDADVWVLSFRFLSSGVEGHVVAREVSASGDRTGRSVPMTGKLSEESGGRLRERLIRQRVRAGATTTVVAGDELPKLCWWMQAATTDA